MPHLSRYFRICIISNINRTGKMNVQQTIVLKNLDPISELGFFEISKRYKTYPRGWSEGVRQTIFE